MTNKQANQWTVFLWGHKTLFGTSTRVYNYTYSVILEQYDLVPVFKITVSLLRLTNDIAIAKLEFRPIKF